MYLVVGALLALFGYGLLVYATPRLPDSKQQSAFRALLNPWTVVTTIALGGFYGGVALVLVPLDVSAVVHTIILFLLIVPILKVEFVRRQCARVAASVRLTPSK